MAAKRKRALREPKRVTYSMIARKERLAVLELATTVAELVLRPHTPAELRRLRTELRSTRRELALRGRSISRLRSTKTVRKVLELIKRHDAAAMLVEQLCIDSEMGATRRVRH